MKKTVKRLVLAKETLRNLEKGELGQVAGADASEKCTTVYSYCPYICDMMVTMPDCIP